MFTIISVFLYALFNNPDYTVFNKIFQFVSTIFIYLFILTVYLNIIIDYLIIFAKINTFPIFNAYLKSNKVVRIHDLNSMNSTGKKNVRRKYLL